MEWSDTALVLHVGRFRETDMWLRLLSRNRGICNVFAFGGSRSRKRFCGCLDLLNTLNCRVKSSRNGEFLALQEGVLLRGPQRLRSDWGRLGMAMNCVRFLDVLGVTRDGAPVAFQLLEDTLACLEGEEPTHPLFPLFFRLRLASDQGFAPALDCCAFCGEEIGHEEVTFLMDEGQIRCARCQTERGSSSVYEQGAHGQSYGHRHDQGARYAVRISSAGLSVLRAVQHTAPAQWDCAALSLGDRRACARAVDGFVQYHLGIAWEEGRFRRV